MEPIRFERPLLLVLASGCGGRTCGFPIGNEMGVRVPLCQTFAGAGGQAFSTGDRFPFSQEGLEGMVPSLAAAHSIDIVLDRTDQTLLADCLSGRYALPFHRADFPSTSA